MSSILKVNTIQDGGGNNLITSDGSGNVTSVGFNNAGTNVLIKTITLSSASTPIQFLNSDADVTFDSTYQTYKFIGNLKYENDSRVTYVRFSTDGTNLDTTSGNYKYDRISSADGSVSSSSDGSSSVIQLEHNASGNSTGEYASFELTLFNNTTLNYPRIICHLFTRRTDGDSSIVFRTGRYEVNSPIQGISFFPNSSNNYDAGATISMYGVKS